MPDPYRIRFMSISVKIPPPIPLRLVTLLQSRLLLHSRYHTSPIESTTFNFFLKNLKLPMIYLLFRNRQPKIKALILILFLGLC
ncbi:hypothetical protein Hanom_Chr10g00967341 [Helianthus anomalus]